MKSFITIIGMLFLTCTSGFAEDVVDYLRARSTGSSVIIEWKATGDREVARYEVERASDDGVFRYIGSVEATDNNQAYVYTDNEAFNKPDGSKIAANYFTYRLRLVYTDKSTAYSSTAGVSHSVSSIKRTWGMIKQMFR